MIIKMGVIKRSPTNYTFELRRTTLYIYIYYIIHTHTHITMKVTIEPHRTIFQIIISNLSILAKRKEKKEGCLD